VSDETYNLALKVPMAMIERLDALVPDVAAEYQHLQAAGLIRKVSRSTVARLVMDAGLEALEAKYKGTPPPQRAMSYTLVDKDDGKKTKAVIPPPTVEQQASGEAPEMARRQAAEPDPDEPESAFLRQYQKPSRMKKPATAAAGRLRKWRQGEGMNQTQAAELLGITQSAYSTLETGKRPPTPPQAAKLAELAGIDPDDWTTPNPDAGEEG